MAAGQVEAVWPEHAEVQGPEPSPAVPDAPPAIQEAVLQIAPRPASKDAAEESPSPRVEAAVNLPEDDMWAADADEEADEADREAAQATEEAAAQPDLEAEAASAEAAREEEAAAAAARDEEESFLLPCERVCFLCCIYKHQTSVLSLLVSPNGQDSVPCPLCIPLDGLTDLSSSMLK